MDPAEQRRHTSKMFSLLFVSLPLPSFLPSFPKVNVRANRKCSSPGCQTRPAYGAPGSGKSQFCKPHALPDMVDVSIR